MMANALESVSAGPAPQTTAQASVFGGDTPEERLKAILRTAQLVPTVLQAHGCTSNIDGKLFITSSGWAALGAIHNLAPKITSVEEYEPGGFRAECVIRFGGAELIRVFSECSTRERGKKERFAAVSMAQTRAISKGLRHVLAPAVSLAKATSSGQRYISDEYPDEAPTPSIGQRRQR